jgi:lysophospholipase L1-like esterase
MARAVGRWVAFSAFLVITVSIGLELAVRTVIPQSLIRDPPDLWEPDAEIGWRRRPNTRIWVNSAGRDVEFCTDALGDRVDCDGAAERSCERRILAIGDSFVEALAVPFRATVWHRLERSTGACVDVAGVGGYEMGQYLKSGRERLAKAEDPYDLVILNFFSGNDFTRDATRIPSSFVIEVGRATIGPRDLGRDEGSALSRSLFSLNRWLGTHSHAYVATLLAIRHVRERITEYSGHGSKALRRSALRRRLLDETARGIRLIADEAERAGSRLLVVIIPHWSQVLDPLGARLVEMFPRFAGDVDMNMVSKRFMPRVRAIPNVVSIDLLPFLRARATRESWALDHHLSVQGHELWHEALQEPVGELLKAGAGPDR